MKVKPGTIVAIEGVVYKFSPTAARVYNDLVEIFEEGQGKCPEIYLYPENQYGEKDVSIPIAKIKEALERAERAEWNKTPHGL